MASRWKRLRKSDAAAKLAKRSRDRVGIKFAVVNDAPTPSVNFHILLCARRTANAYEWSYCWISSLLFWTVATEHKTLMQQFDASIPSPFLSPFCSRLPVVGGRSSTDATFTSVAWISPAPLLKLVGWRLFMFRPYFQLTYLSFWRRRRRRIA